MEYLALKISHITLAITSIVLFLVRAGASINRSNPPSMRFRILAHLVDTLLLGFGVALAYTLAINPLYTPWLGIKLVAIAAYIGCGTLVMKGKTKRIKGYAMAMSLILVVYILMLAINKDPLDLNIF